MLRSAFLWYLPSNAALMAPLQKPKVHSSVMPEVPVIAVYFLRLSSGSPVQK